MLNKKGSPVKKVGVKGTSASATATVELQLVKPPRIQTAEGWKRSMLKKQKKK